MQTKIMEKYFFMGLLLATLVFTFFIFRPFWIVIVLGACFAVVLYPVYEWFNKRKLPQWLSAFITVILFIVILCGPLFGIGVIIFKQSQGIYSSLVNGGQAGQFIDSLNTSINNILPDGVTFNAQEKVSDFVSLLSDNIAKIFSATFSTFFSLILVLLSIFYFLKDGQRWKKAIVKLSPLSDVDDKKILSRLSHSINGIMRGQLLVALVQGFLMSVGLAIFGVPNFALWGLLAAIASLIPFIGTSLISVPAIIFLFMTGHLVPAIGMLIWAIAIVGLADNVLNPVIVSRQVNIPPFLVLFSVLGGIVLLGPIGVLIGPLVTSLLFTLVSIYRHEFKQSTIL